MASPKFAWSALFVVALAFAGLVPAAASAAASQPSYNVVSDSYYHLDVVNGTMSVTVKATFYNAGSAAMKSVPLWVMPGAAAPVVKQGDTPLRERFLGCPGR